MRKEIVLKSCNPKEYGDEVVECRVIENADINAYLATIPEERKFYATKIAPVTARAGIVGEEIHTTLLTERNGQVYILSEEDNTIREREVDGTMLPDFVITNVNSTSKEEYIVKAANLIKMYTQNEDGTWTPSPDERLLTQVDEDVIIKTAWGSEAVCLKGSYIVTYNAEENDFNTLEQGAFNSTYKKTATNVKTKK